MIRSIDLLGPSVSLQIAKKKQFQTNIGAFFTFSILLISIGAFLGFGSDLINRTNPRGTFNKVHNSTQEFMMTDQNFLFSLYDQYTNIPYQELDRKFISVIQHLQTDGLGTDSMTPYRMVQCSDETLKKWSGAFVGIAPNSYRCLPKGTKLKVYGVGSTGKNSILRLQVDYCSNRTVSDNCYSRDFIQTNITGRIQMNYLIESLKIDTLNYTTPASASQVSGLVNTNTQSWTRSTINFKNVKITTDQGFFTKDYKESFYQAVESINTESVYTPDTTTIFSHWMGNSEFTDTYTRNYLKIQEVFALMAGFINAAMIISRSIVSYLVRPEIINMFNKRFRYEEVVTDGRSKILTTSGVKDSTLYYEASIKKSNNFIIESDKEFQRKFDVENFVKLDRKFEYRMNFRQKLFRCCSFNLKNKVFAKIENKILKTISYENLTKMSFTMKILKLLLLETYQRTLIKYCSGKELTPKLNLDEAYNTLNSDEKIHTKNISQKMISLLNNV
jgi:hypothetical protein